MKYIPVIGLEIHAELLTESKVFCSCANQFGGDSNSRVCPRCSALPGTLPVLNKEAVTLAAKAGFALNCTVNNYSAFDRKNYFYPDLPKAYQITQFEFPICSNGYLTIDNKKIRINRIHIEEDAGKLIHDDCESISLADYNRCGIPLIEIVTEPDFRTINEVQTFVENIATRLKYADVCDAKLEQGSLRVDVNISIMPKDSEIFGTRAEIKNLNSIKSIGRAIEYEIQRQTKILESGGSVIQETRRFNDKITTSLRSKEEAHDYRYFPEPDIPPIWLSDEDIAEIKNLMPEMPNERIKRYVSKYNLSEDDACLIAAEKNFSDFYDSAVKINPDYKEISKLMLGELNRCLNESKKNINETNLTPKNIAQLAQMSSDGIISKNAAKDILSIMFFDGGNPMKIAQAHNMIMSSDTSKLEECIDKILSENIDAVKSYKNGNEKILGFFMGQIMRFVGKEANPTLAKDILTDKINRFINN